VPVWPRFAPEGEVKEPQEGAQRPYAPTEDSLKGRSSLEQRKCVLEALSKRGRFLFSFKNLISIDKLKTTLHNE
jgi:hypothetical protein